MREVTLSDVEDVHRLHSLPETDQFNTLGIPDSILVTRNLVGEWVDEQKQDPRVSYVFAIKLRETRQFTGLIAIRLGKSNFRNAEVWYKLDTAYWKNGCATEALLSVLTFGFNELKLHRIEAGCAVENLASIKVLEKAGMVREGMKRKNLPIRGEWQDNYFYAILETEFKS